MGSKHPKSLVEISAAYNAYLRLDSVPDSVPHFETDKNGYPVVEMGEVLCRMPGHFQTHCSRKYASREHLMRHLEKAHGARKADRDPTKWSKKGAVRAQQHYITMMKDQDYVAKGSEKNIHTKASQVSILSAAGRTATPELESGEEVSASQHDSSDISNWLRSARAAPDASGSDNQESSSASMNNTVSVYSSNDDHEQMKIKVEESHVMQSDRVSSRIATPSPIIIDSEDDLVPGHIKVEADQAAPPRMLDETESADEDLELEIEADEIQLRIVRNKQKLAARRRRRQERG